MLHVQNLSKSFGTETLFEGVNFVLNPGDRSGLIGPNGCGKTTLLRILAGEERADRGSVIFDPPGLKPGYLAQGFSFADGETLAGYINRMEGDLPGLSSRLETLAAALAADPGSGRLQAEYDETLTRLSAVAESAGQGPAVLAGLGLNRVPPGLPIATLSGGQKTRLALAGVLLASPPLLLLDEPTNHLDLEMLAWLETLLAGYRGAALIVSHDRAFIDHTVQRILDLDPEKHRVREYTGNYSDYLRQVLAKRERNLSQYKDQVYEIRHMRQDINRTKQQAAWVEQTTTPRQPGVRRIAKKVAAKAKSREKKLERYLESDEIIEKPKMGWQMKLEFSGAQTSGRDALALEDLAVGYNGRALLEGLNQVVRLGARIALTGPNGSGKTTLLKTISGGLPPVAGRVRLGANVQLGGMAQEQEELDPGLNALETIQAARPSSETDARSFLHYYLFAGDDVFTPISRLSYGVRARLSLARLVALGCNLLLLDEPLNHLDIPSRARFEQALSGFEGTVLAVVHDRYFIETFATQVWEIRDGKMLT